MSSSYIYPSSSIYFTHESSLNSPSNSSISIQTRIQRITSDSLSFKVYQDANGKSLPPPKPKFRSKIREPEVKVLKVRGENITVYVHKYYLSGRSSRIEIANGPSYLQGWASRSWRNCKHKSGLDRCIKELNRKVSRELQKSYRTPTQTVKISSNSCSTHSPSKNIPLRPFQQTEQIQSDLIPYTIKEHTQKLNETQKSDITTACNGNETITNEQNTHPIIQNDAQALPKELNQIWDEVKQDMHPFDLEDLLQEQGFIQGGGGSWSNEAEASCLHDVEGNHSIEIEDELSGEEKFPAKDNPSNPKQKNSKDLQPKNDPLSNEDETTPTLCLKNAEKEFKKPLYELSKKVNGLAKTHIEQGQKEQEQTSRLLEKAKKQRTTAKAVKNSIGDNKLTEHLMNAANDTYARAVIHDSTAKAKVATAKAVKSANKEFKAQIDQLGTTGLDMGGRVVANALLNYDQFDSSLDFGKHVAKNTVISTAKAVTIATAHSFGRKLIKHGVSTNVAKKLPAVNECLLIKDVVVAFNDSPTWSGSFKNVSCVGLEFAVDTGCTIAAQVIIPIPFLGAAIGTFTSFAIKTGARYMLNL